MGKSSDFEREVLLHRRFSQSTTGQDSAVAAVLGSGGERGCAIVLGLTHEAVKGIFKVAIWSGGPWKDA